MTNISRAKDTFLKRFYKEAFARPEGKGFSVYLDHKQVKTPVGNPLLLPGPALAEAIAEEWQGQGERIDPATMPLSQMATTVTDFFPQTRPQAIARLVNLAATDTLCHREPAPSPLRVRQEALWQPHLDGLLASAGIRLEVTDEIGASDLPPETKARCEAVLNEMNDWQLQGVDVAASASGSLVLALRMKERNISADEAFAAAELERHFQMEKWGEDDELKTRLAAVRNDLDAVQRWFKLLG